MDIIPTKDNTIKFVKYVSPILDYYMTKYDNFLLLGDFNSEMRESTMGDFCDPYNLTNLVTDPTCFNNPLNTSLIDLILTNRARRFQDSRVIETGLSDHHKLTIIVLRAHFLKQAPITIKYRDYKRFDQNRFRKELLEKLSNINGANWIMMRLKVFFVVLLNKHAPSKKKYIRANSSPFMNKTLSKAVMTRSRLRNKFLKNPNNVNRAGYTKYRNYCTRLFKKVKKAFYNSLDPTLITDNRMFWKTVKPLLSEKHFSSNKITLLEDDEIISKDSEVAETLNLFFSNVVETLNIEGFASQNYSFNHKHQIQSLIALRNLKIIPACQN